MTEPDFTAARGRKFALTLAIAFGVIAAIALLRDRDISGRAFGAIALSFFFAALLVPGRLGGVERAWMKIAHAISKVTTPIFMAIVYFVVLTPAGVIRRLAGANPLVHRASGGSYWIRRPAMDEEKLRRRMERQF
jgi:hypothetical protein